MGTANTSSLVYREIKCKDCWKSFPFTFSEKIQYDHQGKSYPRKCPKCREYKHEGQRKVNENAYKNLKGVLPRGYGQRKISGGIDVTDIGGWKWNHGSFDSNYAYYGLKYQQL